MANTTIKFDEDFGKVYSKVLIKDALTSFVTFDKDQAVKNAGTATPRYSFAVKLPKEIYAQLNKLNLAHPKSGIKAKVSGLKQVEIFERDEDGNLVEDDMGDPIVKDTFYQLTVYQNVGYTDKQGNEITPSTFTKLPLGDFWNGEIIGKDSTASLSLSLYYTEYAGKAYASFNINKILISDLVEVAAKSRSQHEADEWAEMGLDSDSASSSESSSSDMNMEDEIPDI